MPESARHLHAVPELFSEEPKIEEKLPPVEIDHEKESASFVAFSSGKQAASFYQEAFAQFDGEVYKTVLEKNNHHPADPAHERQFRRHVALHKPIKGKDLFTIEIKPNSPQVDEWVKKKLNEQKYSSK